MLTIGLCLGYTVMTVTSLAPWVLAPVAIGWMGLAWLLRWGKPANARPSRKVWPWSLLPIALMGLYVYLSDSFGIVELGAITFHLQAGMADHGGNDRMLAAILYCLSMLALLVSFTWLVRHDHRWRLGERLLALALLAGNPLFYGMTQRGAAIVTDDGAWLNRRYVEPAILEAPERPPNLLILYLESIERTYADRSRFGDAYAHLSALGERAHVFEGVRQLDNTGWTMAGMIGSQCGTPLMPAGLLHDSQFEPLERVVPGVDCLGDLLADQGYRLTFMGGASTTFAGKGVFYEDHGFNEVLGREELRPRLDDPEYVNNWGLFDDSLYDMTLAKIRQLDGADTPWGLVSLSITGHAPNGYPAQACLDRQGEFDGIDILYSVECSGWLARRLIERLEDEGLLDNTLVVVASDHLTMRVSVWDQLIQSERDNTFMLLGDTIEPTRSHRESSIIDVFPTILEAMGFRINNHRAGLGTSLLSNRSTLLERHGMDELAERMREETGLQQRLWEGLVPAGAESDAEEPAPQVVETPQDATEEEPAEVQ
ncbi:phosphatidylglycerol--membrane-oligosaccharide glycerophosphotransferase [Halomonas urumqiensis]|uniref:Phosphatidylglycerol--membrane-oligosaccharide glycerophosphotransferase n=2 Tax=Halomonas urumqiensis TaxID=1684789 RepID=A0A2N7UKJ5_9GAMM|nr:phosphatidylglycerol--membrane-oligosaccharide glycerophosphotransferase [Halomonas urumqiensis]PTB02934.1 phosphatidylglycerol--membrane-oligosaccharide glycerophosphotransferase [Halomonas urumqiensis]